MLFPLISLLVKFLNFSTDLDFYQVSVQELLSIFPFLSCFPLLFNCFILVFLLLLPFLFHFVSLKPPFCPHFCFLLSFPKYCFVTSSVWTWKSLVIFVILQNSLLLNFACLFVSQVNWMHNLSDQCQRGAVSHFRTIVRLPSRLLPSSPFSQTVRLAKTFTITVKMLVFSNGDILATGYQ